MCSIKQQFNEHISSIFNSSIQPDTISDFLFGSRYSNLSDGELVSYNPVSTVLPCEEGNGSLRFCHCRNECIGDITWNIFLKNNPINAHVAFSLLLRCNCLHHEALTFCPTSRGPKYESLDYW
ncbi:hypothetical protein CEXT_321841 [Caerostris extrusa]|uniref:Uncharacterized protein n=1 Tax=Caerostris extrusa TaxID=172846 RepID=A0AAV4V3E8_CAEEX|nr:hypothetical protein CEXT_321841 [Caerostris extrusa]